MALELPNQCIDFVGNDPQLRETLLQVAKLYCDYQQNQNSEPKSDDGNRTQTPPSDVSSINTNNSTQKSDSINSTFSLSPPPLLPPPSGFSVESLCPPPPPTSLPPSLEEKPKIFRPF